MKLNINSLSESYLILVSSSPTDTGLFSEHIPCLPEFTPAATLRNIHILLTIEWGKCEFGTQDIGGDPGPVGGEVFPAAHGQTS